MQFKVYLMRLKGRRRRWDEIMRGKFFEGTLTTHDVDHHGHRFTVATLQTSTGGKLAGLLDLHEPVLTGFAPNAFHLRGFERIEDPWGAYSVIQEWHCEQP
ncbi:MAG: hypothetical protein ACT4P8_20485 [Betaproteobacteria bacterium]